MKIDGALTMEKLEEAGPAAERLEAQGYDGGFSFEGPHDPFLPLVDAARATERLELGTAIAVAFARNPMTCAQQANDLQLLSSGRFVLGLGTQIKPHIVKRFSMPWSRPAARMREFVLAIKAIFQTWETGERLEFRGEFYEHTLMTPFFNPGPNPHGAPPIFVAGVGPKMVEVCGEVADGFFVHPLHTPEYLRAVTLPALAGGAAKVGRDAASCQISCQTIVCLGSNDEEVERARQKARGQISFYGSTPAYRGVLDHHGYEELQPKLNRMSKEGKWLEMMAEIGDDLLDRIAVSGTPAEVAKRLRERNDFADRSMLIVYDEAGTGATGDLVSACQA
ncbi:MAG: TIGR03617 family F420-dependent LLM class oxidoreductase [Myxococcales bacterium]|nr:TIGR03617 family F420-dependent LLM class oxidoreductase [Myxococcales bacterium]